MMRHFILPFFFIGFGFLAFASNEMPAQKIFESLVKKSVSESSACKSFESSLKKELSGAKGELSLKDKKQALKVLELVHDYPGSSSSGREAISMIARGDLDQADKSWLGNQIVLIPGCSIILVYDVSRALLRSAVQYKFSSDEWKQLKLSLMDVVKKLIQTPGPLINSMVASNILKKMEEYKEIQLDPNIAKANQEFGKDLETLRSKLKNQQVGVKANELYVFGVSFVQEAKETEQIRSKYYPKLMNI